MELALQVGIGQRGLSPLGHADATLICITLASIERTQPLSWQRE